MKFIQQFVQVKTLFLSVRFIPNAISICLDDYFIFLEVVLIKEFIATFMCDMEVIITNTEYRTLKKYQQEVKIAHQNKQQLQQELWYLQQENKEKNQIIEDFKKNIKELSKNVMNMSKKILLFDDLLASQEEKWLKRQKELLEKLMNTLKLKEQIQQGWKRERQTLQIKEEKLHQAYTKIKELERQNLAQSAIFKSHKDLIHQLSTSISQLQQQIDDQRINSAKKDISYQQNLLNLRQKQQALLANLQIKETLLQQKQNIIAEKNDVIENHKTKESKMLQNHVKEIDQKENIIRCLEQQFRTVQNFQQSMEHQIELLKAQKLSTKQSFRSIVSSLNNLKIWILQLKKCFQLQFSQVKYFLQQSLSILNQKIQKLEENQRSANGIRLENEMLRKELKQLELQLEQEKSRLKAENQQLVKDNRQAQSRLDEQYNKKSQLNQQISQLKIQLVSEITRITKYQTEIASLQKQICTQQKQIRTQLRTIADLESRLERTSRYKEQEMNTETIQIHQQELYGSKRQSRKGCPNFKEVIDNFWVSIDSYLASKKQYLTSQKQWQQDADLIISQEFKVIIKRFQHKFDEQYGSNGLRK